MRESNYKAIAEAYERRAIESEKKLKIVSAVAHQNAAKSDAVREALTSCIKALEWCKKEMAGAFSVEFHEIEQARAALAMMEGNK